jgi:putative peptidoglycan lipid II flippase
LGLPAAAVMIILSEDICRAIFEYGRFSSEDTFFTARALTFYSLGLPFYTLSRITVPAFYALKDTKLPALVSMTSVLLNVVLCLQFREWIGFTGLALAASVSGVVNIMLLIIFLRRKVKIVEDRQTVNVLMKLVLASGCAGLAAYLLREPVMFGLPSIGPNSVGNLLLLLLAVLLVYLGVCRLLKIREIDKLLELVRRKR